MAEIPDRLLVRSTISEGLQAQVVDEQRGRNGTYPHPVSDWFDVPEGVRLFDTAEEAALAQWASSPAANATVVEVRPSVDATAVCVFLQLGEPTGSYDQDIVTCVRTPAGRWWTSGSGGASSGR